MEFRRAVLADAAAISALIRSLSDPFFQSPGGAGAERFLDAIGTAAIASYLTAGNFRYLVAESAGALVGVVALRDDTHLYHLFVADACQGRGVARRLWNLVRAEAEHAAGARRFTVNASLNAVPVYERFGFRATGPQVALHGVVFLPMVRDEV